MADEVWTTYVVPWAPHVVGQFTARVVDAEAGTVDQRYKVECGTCGAKWGPVPCTSGMVRKHIANFAVAHQHNDPLAPKAARGRRPR